MERCYEKLMKYHLEHDRQMVFLEGPRQVGKTTISKTAADLSANFIYLNWDNDEDQQFIMGDIENLLTKFDLHQPQKEKAILVLDEIDKYKHWRNYLKGFYDKQSEILKFIVTGSSKMNIYRTTGDSLMGRYFSYRVHPLSVAELINPNILSTEIRAPKKLNKEVFENLIQFSGYPEPFIKQSDAFYRRWSKLRMEQLFTIDIQQLTRIHEIAQIKFLASILKNQVSSLLNYSQFSKAVRVSNDTIINWINTLASFYYCFNLYPWTKNINRSLLKQPKLYLWDWSLISDAGARNENFVACHLLKAIQLWQDQGLGEYGLYFLRNKEKQEVDFVVTKENKPWFLVEVKTSNNKSISESLHYFQKMTGASHAFQVVFDLPYEEINCFDYHKPIIVPAITFLSQLV